MAKSDEYKGLLGNFPKAVTSEGKQPTPVFDQDADSKRKGNDGDTKQGEQPREATGDNQPADDNKEQDDEPPLPEPEVNLGVTVPKSVRRAVRRRAADNDNLTARSIVLQGLQAIGFDINETELCDRRRETKK